MNNIEQAISFARQEYTRQGLDALYQKDFEEALLPALSQAAEIYRADTLRWSGDPKTDLLAALLWSQKLLNDYQRHQLPDEVFYHTIDDIGRWASEYWSYSGKIGLADLLCLRCRRNPQRHRSVGRLDVKSADLDRFDMRPICVIQHDIGAGAREPRPEYGAHRAGSDRRDPHCSS